MKVIVSFGHDMTDSWYNASFPDPAHDGTYDTYTSIEKIAAANGWTIEWQGDGYYNPRKKT
jgi:hypothetical protein